MLASAPYLGRLPFWRLFGFSVLFLGQLVTTVICGLFVTPLVVDWRPSVLEVGLVVESAVGLIVASPWCTCLRPISWLSSLTAHLRPFYPLAWPFSARPPPWRVSNALGGE